jgi:cobalt-zinc-cadmium efflux system membrane fusion protein
VGNQSVAALPLDAVVQSEGKNFIFIVDETETHEAHDEKAEQPATAEAEAKEQEHAADEKEHHGEGTHFRKVEVATGVSELGYVEITPIGELPAGAKVVVKGAFYLLSKVSAPAEHDH